MNVVFSRQDAEDFTIPGTDRTYRIAPLTYRQRQAFRAELAREAGIFPQRAQMLEALRAAVRDLRPDNEAGMIAAIDAHEADDIGENREAASMVSTLEVLCARTPQYGPLLAAHREYMAAVPWVAARHALRGWSGAGLPAFSTERGIVPADLLDMLPPSDIEAVGWRAQALMQPGPSAVGNSVPPSSSPETPEPSTAD